MWFMTMWGKQILARAIEIQKENGGGGIRGGGVLTTYFLEIIKQQLF